MKQLLCAAIIPLTLGACASEEKITFFSLLPPSSKDIVDPVNLPPDDFAGEFWIDRDGCTFIRTGSGEWVPQMNLDRTRVCDSSLRADAKEMADTLAESSDALPIPSQEIPRSYVQVGLYKSLANRKAVRETFAKMGFPIFGDESNRAVVLGPYFDQGFLDDALNTARAEGHGDAFVFEN